MQIEFAFIQEKDKRYKKNKQCRLAFLFFFFPNNAQLARKFEPEIWSLWCFHVLLGLSIGNIPQAIVNGLGWREMHGHGIQNPPLPMTSY